MINVNSADIDSMASVNENINLNDEIDEEYYDNYEEENIVLEPVVPIEINLDEDIQDEVMTNSIHIYCIKNS